MVLVLVVMLVVVYVARPSHSGMGPGINLHHRCVFSSYRAGYVLVDWRFWTLHLRFDWYKAIRGDLTSQVDPREFEEITAAAGRSQQQVPLQGGGTFKWLFWC